MISKDAKIYVAGHRGMVGSALCRYLESQGYANLITRTRSELDLLNQQAVNDFFATEQPQYVLMAAARVGGIGANSTYPAEFIYENLMVEVNCIHAAWANDVQRLLFLGSSCIYPRMAPQPMAEAALLTSELEPTNEPYAIAKIAGIKLCESYNRQYGTDFRSVMPTNLYGPGDNFDAFDSHVIPALIRKFHEAKQNNDNKVEIWGSGKPRREFLHVDDMAEAGWHVMQLDAEVYRGQIPEMLSHINIGSGVDVSIKELAELIQQVTGFHGELVLDSSKPDGSPRKLLNIDRIRALGWQPKISLEEGLKATYQWFIENERSVRGTTH